MVETRHSSSWQPCHTSCQLKLYMSFRVYELYLLYVPYSAHAQPQRHTEDKPRPNTSKHKFQQNYKTGNTCIHIQ